MSKNKKMSKKEIVVSMDDVFFGDTVKCFITKYEGVITGRYSFLTGCDRWSVIISKEDKEIYVILPILIMKCNIVIPKREDFEFSHGDAVEDILTGKKLCIIKTYQDISGYNRYYCRLLNPKTLKEISTLITYEEVELELIKKSRISDKIDKIRNNIKGGKPPSFVRKKRLVNR